MAGTLFLFPDAKPSTLSEVYSESARGTASTNASPISKWSQSKAGTKTPRESFDKLTAIKPTKYYCYCEQQFKAIDFPSDTNPQ